LKPQLTSKVGVSSSKIDAVLNKSKYRSVIEQYLLDTKQIKDELSEVSMQKVEMGKVMEPIIKDLVEKNLGVKLTVDKTRFEHDQYDFFTIEFDALDLTHQVIYEFKNTEKDERHIRKTYYPQVQFAMYMSNFHNARICYLRNGWELGYINIKRDENFIKYMIEAGIYYATCLRTKTQPDPAVIDAIASNIDFYRGEENTLKGVGVNLDLSIEDIEKLYEWNDIKQQIAKLEVQEGAYRSHFSEKYGKYTDNTVSFSNIEIEKEGAYDLNALIKDNPNIDFRKYKRDNNKFSRQQLRVKKPKEASVVLETNTEDLV
jgi:predicted phage-related endonuclease